MKKSILVLPIAMAVALGSTQAQAKVKGLTVKVKTPTASAKVLSGKATPGSKITVTRYHVVYASGHANKRGAFTLHLRHHIKAGWHYKVTVGKVHYKSKSIVLGVKTSAKKIVSENPVNGSLSTQQETPQNTNSQQVINQSTSNQTTEKTTVPTISDTARKESKKARLNTQKAQLEDSISYATKRISDLQTQDTQIRADIADLRTKMKADNAAEDDATKAEISKMQQQVASLTWQIKNAVSASDKSNFTMQRTSLEKQIYDKQTAMDKKTVGGVRVNDIAQYSNMISAQWDRDNDVEKEIHSLQKSNTDLQSKIDAINAQLATIG